MGGQQTERWEAVPPSAASRGFLVVTPDAEGLFGVRCVAVTNRQADADRIIADHNDAVALRARVERLEQFKTTCEAHWTTDETCDCILGDGAREAIAQPPQEGETT